MTERVVPYHCPYCGEEDLRPHEAGHGAWECRACLRAFSVTFLGLLDSSVVQARFVGAPGDEGDKYSLNKEERR